MAKKSSERAWRYSDANTDTDNLTLAKAQKFQRLQNGGKVTMMPKEKAIIIAPVGRNTHGRIEFAGTEYESLEAARIFTKNAGRLAGAILLYNGIQYGTAPEDFEMAETDIVKIIEWEGSQKC